MSSVSQLLTDSAAAAHIAARASTHEQFTLAEAPRGFAAQRATIAVSRASLRDVDAILEYIWEATALAPQRHLDPVTLIPALLRGEISVAIARNQDEVVGLAIGSALGMRGLIQHVSVAAQHRDGPTEHVLVQEILGALAESGVHRVHLFYQPANEQLKNRFAEMKFAPQVGERLLQRNLTAIDDPGLRPRAVHPDIALREARPEDLPQLFATLAPIPELAFQPWETSLLEAQVRSGSGRSTFLIATTIIDGRERFVGALIGGHDGIDGTVNHIWVAEGYRKHGIASCLFQQSLQDFQDRGVRRLYIILVAGNVTGGKFWECPDVGFRELVNEESFLEIDV